MMTSPLHHPWWLIDKTKNYLFILSIGESFKSFRVTHTIHFNIMSHAHLAVNWGIWLVGFGDRIYPSLFRLQIQRWKREYEEKWAPEEFCSRFITRVVTGFYSICPKMTLNSNWLILIGSDWLIYRFWQLIH